MGVIREMQKKIEPLMKEAQSGRNVEEIRPNVMKIRKDSEAKIEAILSDAQKNNGGRCSAQRSTWEIERPLVGRVSNPPLPQGRAKQRHCACWRIMAPGRPANRTLAGVQELQNDGRSEPRLWSVLIAPVRRRVYFRVLT